MDAHGHGLRYTDAEREAVVQAAQQFRGGVTSAIYDGIRDAMARGTIPISRLPSKPQFHRWLRGRHPDSPAKQAPSTAPNLAMQGEAEEASAHPRAKHVTGGGHFDGTHFPSALLERRFGAEPLEQLNQRLSAVAINLQRLGHYAEIAIIHRRLNKALGKLRQGAPLVRNEGLLRQELDRFIEKCERRVAEVCAAREMTADGASQVPLAVMPQAELSDTRKPSAQTSGLPMEKPVNPLQTGAAADGCATRDAGATDFVLGVEADDLPLYHDPRAETEEGADWGISLAVAELGCPQTGTVIGTQRRTKADEQSELRARILGMVLGGHYTAEHMAEQVRAALAGRGDPDIRALLCDVDPTHRRRFLRLTARTIARWRRAYEKAEAARKSAGAAAPVCLASVLRHTVHRSSSTRVASPEVIALVRQIALDPACLDWSARDIKQHVAHKLRVAISERSIQRIIANELTDAERIRARGGSDAVDLVFRRYLYREAPFAGNSYIIDHSAVKQETLDLADGAADCTDFDFQQEYIDSRGHRPERRRSLWITRVIDAYSRRTLALRLWTKAPGTQETLITLYDAMRRFGVPNLLYSDNGADFRSKLVREVTQRLGVRQIFTRPYTPQGRAKLERSFRTLKERYFKLLPGYYGGRHPRAIDEADLWTVDDVEEWLQKRVEESDATEVHSETRRRPAEHFDESIGARRATGDWAPADARWLPFLLPVRTVKSTRAGIELLGHRYFTERLQSVPVGATLHIRFDPSNLTVVFVTLPGPRGTVVFLGPAERYDANHQPPSFLEQRHLERLAQEAERHAVTRRRKRAEQERQLAAAHAAKALLPGTSVDGASDTVAPRHIGPDSPRPQPEGRAAASGLESEEGTPRPAKQLALVSKSVSSGSASPRGRGAKRKVLEAADLKLW
jgi:hypothetical protein